MNRTLIKLYYCTKKQDVPVGKHSIVRTWHEEGCVYLDEVQGATKYSENETLLRFAGENARSIIKKPLEEVMNLLVQADKEDLFEIDWRSISLSQADADAKFETEKAALPVQTSLISKATQVFKHKA